MALETVSMASTVAKMSPTPSARMALTRVAVEVTERVAQAQL